MSFAKGMILHPKLSPKSLPGVEEFRVALDGSVAGTPEVIQNASFPRASVEYTLQLF